MGHREPEPGGADDLALLDEAMKKCGLIWLEPQSGGSPQARWHVWVDGAAYLLTGPGDQPAPDLTSGDTVRVVVRSKDNTHRLVVFGATVDVLSAADAAWQPATTALAAGRLNLSQAEQAPARWADDPAVVIYRIRPTGGLLEGPGRYGDDPGRATPVPTPATTVGRRPWVLHRRGGSGSDLSAKRK